MSRSARPRTASVQVWQGYLTNRGKRLRDGRFLVHGVRPITRALACGWPLETLVYRLGGPELSGWAREVLDTSRLPRVGLVPELMAELGDGVPELVAVAVSRPGELDDFAPGVPGGPPPVVLVADRPDSPDVLGALIRTADAFGAAGVVITGPGADHHDPRTVRASTGSLFAVPVFRAGGAAQVLTFAERQRRRGIPTRVVLPGTTGTPVDEYPFDQAAVVVVGDERGTWPGTDQLTVPGAADTIGAAATATVALYEIARQRHQDYRPQHSK
ncbi:TrmH family RNA methyltransferase [Nocardia asteroides]|uniref:TrmH family RNA methyltransferase n=1 Tax=Nocardia asteroides TaxID=1824 RepID=UPI001E52AE20|nr:TrmH family RNA methyltransferase [Nocardia asteroides]UGT63522.1 rRNA methyltransferase [Nocardia asteroides]